MSSSAPASTSAPRYSIGLDFGTNSARCLIVRAEDGAEIASAVSPFASGESGILLDRRDPDLARQHPGDYLRSLEECLRAALADAARDPAFSAERVVGIGVDATGSTPIPVDANGLPLALLPEFADDPNAMAWLWKDHTSTEEAEAITRRAAEMHPEYLAKCGGTYSSEWFFSKIWHCLRVAPKVFHAAATWVEEADWIPAWLCGATAPGKLRAGICAAGHKGLYHESWGGYPSKEFLAGLAPELGELRDRLPARAITLHEPAGRLSSEIAERFGLPPGIPVAVGVIDAHMGAIGAGIRPGRLVKILGTSTCDMMVWPMDGGALPDIPGVCGIVPGSILPDCHGIEAGQSAVGDIFNWFVERMRPGGAEAGSHEALTERALALRPGESGLLALDWNNGNRCVLVDQRLTGLLIGQTLATRPEEIYRALIEATAFGALAIIERLGEYGVAIDEVVNCGGIAEKSPLTMQIYADVTGRPMKLSRSSQTCALGSAVAGAVVAGVHASFGDATEKMTGVKDLIYTPDPAAHAVYRELYALYRDLHDAFGVASWSGGLAHVMKRMIEIRNRERRG